MDPIVWIGSAAVAFSLPIAWWAIDSDRKMNSRVSQNLADRQPTTLRAAVLERSPTERYLGPVFRDTGRRLLRFTPVGWHKKQTALIGKAGILGRVSPEQILGAKLLFPLVVGLLLLPRLTLSDTRGFLLAVSFIVMSFFLPDLLLRSLADRRAEEITLVLPDVLDQLTISVEAGLGFEAALARIAEADDHALSQEFGRMLQDIQLGTRRVDALDAVAQRTSVDDLRQVVLALRQAESLGVPLAKTLRSLALEMREKRRFRAEERAHQLPIKMIFPLGLCILPALFIVILGPAVITFNELF